MQTQEQISTNMRYFSSKFQQFLRILMEIGERRKKQLPTLLQKIKQKTATNTDRESYIVYVVQKEKMLINIYNENIGNIRQSFISMLQNTESPAFIESLTTILQKPAKVEKAKKAFKDCIIKTSEIFRKRGPFDRFITALINFSDTETDLIRTSDKAEKIRRGIIKSEKNLKIAFKDLQHAFKKAFRKTWSKAVDKVLGGGAFSRLGSNIEKNSLALGSALVLGSLPAGLTAAGLQSTGIISVELFGFIGVSAILSLVGGFWLSIYGLFIKD